MECITTVSYSFLLNDEAVGCVVPQRGIRQGDPMSPYIFILCGEVLSGLCKKAQEDGSLPGIRVARNSPKINNLLFADDTMFFTKTDSHACSNLVAILQTYEAASGQKINTLKSSIFFPARHLQTSAVESKCSLVLIKKAELGNIWAYQSTSDAKRKTSLHRLLTE